MNYQIITPTRRKSPTGIPAPSEFKSLPDIEYFDFEEDFIEKNVRCIPMVVRFKMDAAGIKLKLSEWSKFEVTERILLAVKPAATQAEVANYKRYLSGLVRLHTSYEPTYMAVDPAPEWSKMDRIPDMLLQKASELHYAITRHQWQSLTDLQRFALLKLCRPGHENKNFPKAMREFKLTGG